MQTQNANRFRVVSVALAALFLSGAQAHGEIVPRGSHAVLVPSVAAKAGVKKKAGKKLANGKSESKKKADPTAETAEMRERRLLRECKGRPNAGACTGYAS